MKFIPPQTTLPAAALLLDNSHNVLDLTAQQLAAPAVLLQFPKWTDGRAYSQAVLLRSRLHYRGEICAQGEVLADMLPMLQRCGFDAVQLRADQRLAVAQRALAFFGPQGPRHPQALQYQQVPSERQARLARPISLPERPDAHQGSPSQAPETARAAELADV